METKTQINVAALWPHAARNYAAQLSRLACLLRSSRLESDSPTTREELVMKRSSVRF